MNNKNNEGKTFGDIFSKIDNNTLSNDDNKKKDSDNAVLANKTFNSIFDKAVADVSNDKESVSFSSVFNVVKDDENADANKEKKETSSDIFSKVLDNDEDEKKSSSNVFDAVKEEDKESDEEIEDNLDKDEKVETFSNVFDEIKEDDSVEDTNDENEKSNPFMSAVDDVVEKDEDVEEFNVDKDNSDNTFNPFETVSEEQLIEEKDSKIEESNPFINTVSDTTVEEIKDENEDKSSVFDSDENNNPFMNAVDTSDSSKEEMYFDDDEKIDTKDDDLEKNIFFAKDTDEESSNTLNNNPFMVSSKTDSVEEDKKEENNIFDKSFEEDKKEEKVKDDGDVNPFFDEVEEATEKVNPLFENKINLVEKPEFSDKDVNGKINLDNVQNFDVKIRKKKPNILQAIIGILSYALFIWLLLVGIALLVYVLDIKIRAAKGDNSPPKYGAYVVLTGSMLPEIQVFDVVITKKQDAKDLKEKDVITFESTDPRFEGTIITHRIIKKNYNSKTKSYTFQTKGDYNNVADSALVIPEKIRGKVIFKIPKLGYLREFLQQDGGWILAILFPCLLIVSYDIVKISKGLRKKKYKNLVVQSR